MEILTLYIVLCVGCRHYLKDILDYSKEMIMDLLRLEKDIDREDEGVIYYILEVLVFVMAPIILYRYFRGY